MIENIFKISHDVRYVAIYQNGKLEKKSKENTDGASSSESDKYEELIVNPVMLTAASQRGNLDCGGLDYLLIKYGNFFQYVFQIPSGHVSVCIDKDSDPIAIGKKVRDLFK
ncbi:hypothetical protein [Agarilytica rhodophyticola]|uniref:hypothetical protein n=1 Tax=Agarilytica rhodophyticola TaxID=1737490 RepID=UPI001C1F7A09|nr:hypothetical protein [Agarilytica rhodophyticola]